MNTNIIFYTELESCLKFIQINDKEKIFLITSGFNADEILQKVVRFNQIDAIFIICIEKTKYIYLINLYSKIIDIYTDLNCLYASIQKEIDFIDKKLLTFNFFNEQQNSIEYITKESAKFLWFQLFKYIISHLSYNQRRKKSLINICQEYYQNNIKEKKLIHQFEQEYQSKKALQWYLKESFISKYLTKALKNQDIDQLYKFAFFINDLTKNLVNEREKILLSNEKLIIVYYGTKLTKKELKKFKDNEGTLISMNNYLFASRLQTIAVDLAIKSTKRNDYIPVIFEIECNLEEHGKNIIFADINQYSQYLNRKEVLFDINTTFRLKNIEYQTQICLIKMNATNDGQKILKDYLEEKYYKTEEKNFNIVFGRLMCHFEQYDKAQKYFEELLNNSNEYDIPWIEFNLGRIYNFKNQLNIAQDYYNRAYNRMINTKPIRSKEATYILNKLGIIFYEQEKYDKALNYYQQALKIQQKYNSSDLIDIARIYNNIALILNIQGNYNKALDHYQQALKMFQKCYTSDHIEIARNLNNIGNILYEKGEYDEAADNYQQALKMQQNLYPNGRTDTAQILNNIGLILNIQGKCNEAFDICQHALKMQQKLFPYGHIDIAGSFNNIGIILYNRGKYDEALYYHQQAFKIREKYYPSGHIDTARSLNNIGNILYQQNKYDEALNYYLQALTMQEKFYSPDHIDIALCLNNIGCTLNRQGKYDEAFHYHQNALKIQQKFYISDHPDIAYTFTNIGNILYQKAKYNEALDYHQQALKIREKFYPSDHMDIGESLNNIGMIYEHMQKSKMSLAYFQRVLVLYKKILPSGHPYIETAQKNTRHITAKK